jgi:hypothetical protein
LNKRLSVAVTLIIISVFSTVVRAKTVTGTIFDDVNKYYSFHTGTAGQYDFSLSWDQDGLDSMLMVLVCDNESRGASAGFRESFSRLSIGLEKGLSCVLGLALATGYVSDYTLNVSNTLVSFNTKSKMPTLDRTLRQIAASASQNRQARKGPKSSTELTQIRAGENLRYRFTVPKDGYLMATAMWNRKDTSIHLALVCEGDLLFGDSKGVHDRLVRLDADLISYTDCVVTVRSKNTAVVAINFMFMQSTKYTG